MDKKQLVMTLVAVAALGIIVWKFRASISTWWQVLGLILLLTGFVLWTIARFQLGASFAVTAQARQLVTRGIYSKIRNPIYIFGSWLIAGAFLVIGRPLWLLIFVIIIPHANLASAKRSRRARSEIR
jgi:protein-S-isoprenylcysteine O-methyltransferase Ste14